MEVDDSGVTIRTYQMIETEQRYSISAREYHPVLTPHPNVALFRHSGQAEDGKTFHASVSHSKDLVDVMCDCLEEGFYLSDEYRKRLLLQITHGLHHLHRYNIVHGHVTPANILFPRCYSCANVVLADFEYCDATSAAIRRDITQLADLFEYILKNGDLDLNILLWRDAEIAYRLLKDMRDESMSYSTKDILRHPFFWSDDKKINFLSRSVDILDNMKKMAKLDEKQSYSDWAEQLILSAYEYDQCNQFLAHRNISSSKDAVKQRAVQKHKGEKRTKISELLRFFRNTKTHFCELLGPISWSFLDDETTCFYRFFAKRYPSLFYHVYDTMMEHELLHLRGVKVIYLETTCENAPLQIISDNKIEQQLYEQDMQHPQ